MSALSFRAAVEDDWAEVSRLLTACRLPLDGARDRLASFLLGYRGGALVATAAVERYGEVGLLRSVATAEGERGIGTGEEIVRRRLDHAQDEGLSSLVLLTTTAADFFERFGFARIERAAVSGPVQDSVEFAHACPASAVVMHLNLDRPPVLVRRAHRDDASAIARIYNEGIDDRSTLETDHRSTEDRANWLSARGGRHPVLVAVRRGTVCGWIALSPFNPRPAYRFVADLGIYVGRGVRGQGIGSRLLQSALERARDLGYHKLVLTTFPTLTAALALYEKFGFRLVGDYREQGQLDGRWVDTRIMEKIVD